MTEGHLKLMPILKSEVSSKEAGPVTDENDGFSKEAPLIVESAKSGRSKCSACCEKIETGQSRVGVFAFKGGRLCYAWVHPHCFLKAARVDYNTSGRGKCKVTGKEFVKGQFRFAYRVGGGEKSFAYISMDGVGAVLPKVLEVSEFLISDRAGLEDLKSEDRAAFLHAAGPPSQQERPHSSQPASGEKRKASTPEACSERPARKPKTRRAD